MFISYVKIIFLLLIVSNFLPAQDYEIKFDSLNASGWFGGDSRPGQERNVAVAQSVLIEEPITLESFAFFFTSAFDSASSASGAGYEVTLSLHIRDSSGVILKTENVVVPDTFTVGWIKWENINFDLPESGTYIFSTYLVGGYDSLPVNSGQGCDLNSGYPHGERFSKHIITDEDAEFWGDWSQHPWDSNFWLTGTLLPTSVEDYNIVNKFFLEQNYPNPFNPTTALSFVIGQSSLVSLKVYDVLGNEVATLVDEYKQAGNYKVEFNSEGLASGIYFYRIKTDSFSDSKKMILLR